MDARKDTVDADDAWKLIQRHETVVIGKGKKYVTYTPSDADKEEILKQALGRSGTLRAPTLTVGNTLVVGYNDEMYQSLVNG